MKEEDDGPTFSDDETAMAFAQSLRDEQELRNELERRDNPDGMKRIYKIWKCPRCELYIVVPEEIRVKLPFDPLAPDAYRTVQCFLCKRAMWYQNRREWSDGELYKMF